MKTKLPMTLAKLQKKADRLFQRLRVMQEVKLTGYGECITCGVILHFTKLDGGHFIGKGMGGAFLSVRYEPDNVWPQCQSCNRFQSGNYSIYRDNLIKIIGKDRVEALEKKKYETVIFARSLYEKVIEECKKEKSK